MVNYKIPRNTSTHVNFNHVTLGDLIKASFHKFDFGDTPNGLIKNDIIDKNHHTDNDGDTPMILINISKRENFYP